MSQKHYETLLGKSISAKIAENLERRQRAERFRVIDPANFPEKPFKPNPRKLLAAGTFGGFALGVGLALLIEMLNPCFRKPEDFDGFIPHHLLITIPKFSKENKEREIARKLKIIPAQKRKQTHL
jgi:capsular polysaccharide biosynthesis protein